MKKRLIPLLLALPLAAFAVASVSMLSSASAKPSTSGATASKASPTVVSTRHTSLGTILVGPNGHTLYLFEKDTKGHSACTGSCASSWPPLMASDGTKAGMGASSSMLGTISRSGGKQVTYGGHPLYYFAEDTKAGQTNGENLDAFGAHWEVVSPSGKAITKG